MVTAASEAEAASFKVYSSVLHRYYSSANGTDLYKYFKVNDITDIHAGDEILIVYNDDGVRKVMAYTSDSGMASALFVLPERSTIDSRDSAAIYDPDVRYKYRLDTSEYVKKPYAYFDEDTSIIWAQGVASHIIGNAKENGETNKQRKYEYVWSVASNRYLYLKNTGSSYIYYDKPAQVTFYPGDNQGEFFIRESKDTRWLGKTSYDRYVLDITTGNYSPDGVYRSFMTVDKADRIPVEIYRRPSTDEVFNVEYYSADSTATTPERIETKPQDSFTLTQNSDEEHDGTNYIFVGWTTDKDKSGYLSLDDSANIYDYDDLSKVASVRSDKRTELSLLGDCNPEATNLIDYKDIAGKVVVENEGTEQEKTVLKVYPVYAVRGYSAAVTANEDGRMIVGASDFKDLQMGGNGSTDSKERWQPREQSRKQHCTSHITTMTRLT